MSRLCGSPTRHACGVTSRPLRGLYRTHRPRKEAPHVHAPLLSEATAWEGTGKRVEEVHQRCADLRMVTPHSFRENMRRGKLRHEAVQIEIREAVQIEMRDGS